MLRLFLAAMLAASGAHAMNLALEMEKLRSMSAEEIERAHGKANKPLSDELRSGGGGSSAQFNATAFVIEYFTRHAGLRQQLADVAGVPTDKGLPWPEVEGPPSKNSRIAVVGAGPSGCHMAYALSKRGYKDITIYERTNRVGGKSNDVLHRGTHYTTSTYLVTPDYAETISAFIAEQGLGTTHPWNLTMRVVNDYRVPPPPSTLIVTLQREGLTLEQFFSLCSQYITLHRSLFGIYEGELMPQPDFATMQLLKGTFYEFLERNGLEKLASTFERVLRIPGYARVKSTGAIHALLWLTPRHLVDGTLGTGNQVANIQGGFTEIFRRMLQLAELTPKFDTDVLAVRRRGKKLLLKLSTQPEEEVFDFVVWSGLPSDFPQVARPNVVQCPEDVTVLKSSFYRASAGAVVNMRNDARVGTSEFYDANFLEDDRFDHLVHISADVQAEYDLVDQAAYAARDYSVAGVPINDTYRTLSVLNYGDLVDREDPEDLMLVRQKLVDHFQDGFNATDIDILHMEFVRYLPQWSVEDIAKGYHWRMFNMQGRYNVWFVGGGYSWDSTKSCMEYNNLILRQAGLW